MDSNEKGDTIVIVGSHCYCLFHVRCDKEYSSLAGTTAYSV